MGRAIEEIGIYQPLQDPSVIRVDSDRVQYWLGVGAQPTEAVRAILKVTGDWQRFRGEPGAEGTLQVAAPKENKTVAYEAAVKDAEKEKAAKPKKAAKPSAEAKPAKEAKTTKSSQESAPVEASETAEAEPAGESTEAAAEADGEPAEEPSESA